MPPLQGKTKTYSNLVLVGPRSVNNRVYAPDVLRKAVENGLYNGVPIFLDHEEKIQTLVGRVTKAYWDEDKNCIRGDIEIYDSPYSSIIDIIINVFGGEFGFSHVVEAEVDEDKESGKEYVKSISKVKSVDLVTDPATTKGINEVQERVMSAIRNVIKESRIRKLKECGENTTQKPAVNMQSLGVVDSLIQSYYNGEISLPALVKLLEILSQGELRESVERKECCQESEGKAMPKRKLKEQEVDLMKDDKMDEKDKEVVNHEDTKEQEEDKEKEDDTLEEDSHLEGEGEDKKVEEAGMEEENYEDEEPHGEDEELEEEYSEDAEDDEDVEEGMDEEAEEDHEEDENDHEDKEIKESKKRSANKTKQVKESVLSLKRELNLTRKKLRESQKLLEEIVKSRYIPSLKEYKIISESKDPVGLIKILSEKRVVVTKSKPKTISESRNKTQQPDEWDQMIEEVRRRKGLIR
jgi:hypothetical protein